MGSGKDRRLPAKILRFINPKGEMASDSPAKTKRLAGREEANVDDKGRVLFSKRKREILGRDFVMRLGDNGCICVYSEEEWAGVTAEMDGYPKTSPGRQLYSRLLMETAVEELGFDAQGRTVIPRMLRDMAKIAGAVVIIGADERAEIWAADEHERYLADPVGYGGDRIALFDDARRRMRGEL